MHFRLRIMSKQQHPASPHASKSEIEEIEEITDGTRRSRTLQLARRHPMLTVAGVATIGLFAGIELAAGVLLGAGVATVVRSRRSRPPLPLAQQQAAPAQEPEAHEPEAQESETVERARAYVDRMTPEIRRRVKAVVQAARGRLAPEGT